MNEDYYRRPMVVRLRKIFNKPKPPSVIIEEQFDGDQEKLERLASKQWHEITDDDFSCYLDDLNYVNLQGDLFDYLFPVLLIRWWECQQSGARFPRMYFYNAILNGRLLDQRMNSNRKELFLDWMTDAYLEGIANWGGHLSTRYVHGSEYNLGQPLMTFNALGESVPMVGKLLHQLSQVSNLGQAQWWLVFGTGIAWNENDSPFIPGWDRDSGGGGVYLTESDSDIYDSGFTSENLYAMQEIITPDLLCSCLQSAAHHLQGSPHEKWAEETRDMLEVFPDRTAQRLDQYLKILALPRLDKEKQMPLSLD
jgi:hypothetical protein